MYSDEHIKQCYYKMLYMRGQKQKDSVDVKSEICKKELEKRADLFKQRVKEDARKQLELIDKNTEMFKRQVDEEAEVRKKLIDDNMQQKINAGVLSLEDVRNIIELLYKG